MIFDEFSGMMGDVDDLGGFQGSIRAMAMKGKRTSKVLGSKALSGRSIPRNISFKQYVKKYSFAYRGKYKGRGTYLKVMAKDWRAITGK